MKYWEYQRNAGAPNVFSFFKVDTLAINMSNLFPPPARPSRLPKGANLDAPAIGMTTYQHTLERLAKELRLIRSLLGIASFFVEDARIVVFAEVLDVIIFILEVIIEINK